MEKWKKIEGHEEYEISNRGRIRRDGKINKLNKETRGYLGIKLYKNGKYRRWLVHRLVARAFIENPENRPHINHINEDKEDNRVENLEWVTPKENMDRYVENNPEWVENIRRVGEGHGVEVEVYKDGECIGRFSSMMKCSRALGYNENYVAKAIATEGVNRKGYVFKKVEGK